MNSKLEPKPPLQKGFGGIYPINQLLTLWFSLNEKLRFLLVGGYNTIFSYFIFVILNHYLENSLHYLPILSLCYLLSIFNSFITYKFFVFQTSGNGLLQYLKVNIVYLIYFILNSIMLYILKGWLKIDVLIAQAICAITLAILTYFMHKNFSFKKR